MKNLKSRPCRDFLFLMDQSEDPSYTKNLKAVIESYKKRGIKINQEELEKEIDIYI